MPRHSLPSSLTGDRTLQQWLRSIGAPAWRYVVPAAALLSAAALWSSVSAPVSIAADPPKAEAGEDETYEVPTGPVSTVSNPTPVKDAKADTQAEMKPYVDVITGSEVKFDMLPIPGGKFKMGSPADEQGRNDDEGPQHEVEIAPFWMAKFETTWDQYDIFSFRLDIKNRKASNSKPGENDGLADAVTRPTKPYTDMTFGMGHDVYPAICMTQLAAETYCKWLSAKTGRYYRLPTEAEWEYACRASTTTAYSFGDDAKQLNDYAWNYENSDFAYHPVGKKKPNPWGLYDMHGNVMEWCQDEYTTDFYGKFAGKVAVDPVIRTKEEYSHVTRGGSWDDNAPALRSAARKGSEESWKQQDPQVPQSVWYFTDALWVGFRVVRPLHEPDGWREKLAKEMEEERKIQRNRE